VTISLPLLDAGVALYPPVIDQGGITLPLLDAGADLYAPVLSAVNLLTIPLLDAVPELYAPVIERLNWTIRLPLLDAGVALYAPDIDGGLQLDDISLGVIHQEFWPRKRRGRDHYTL
jgi:hypothetical protein